MINCFSINYILLFNNFIDSALNFQHFFGVFGCPLEKQNPLLKIIAELDYAYHAVVLRSKLLDHCALIASLLAKLKMTVL